MLRKVESTQLLITVLLRTNIRFSIPIPKTQKIISYAIAGNTQYHTVLSHRYNLCDGTFSRENNFSVEPYNQNRSRYKEERVVGLGVGPDRIYELKMHQCREQDATTRCIK